MLLAGLLSLGVSSTLRLVSLGLHSGADALRSVPTTGVSQALALPIGALLTGLVMSPLLSSGNLLFALYSNISSEAVLC